MPDGAELAFHLNLSLVAAQKDLAGQPYLKLIFSLEDGTKQ